MDATDLVPDRQRWLLDQLTEQRRVVTTEAAEHLGVSVDTIRRDLRSLHHEGLARRIHGGAVPISTLSASFRGRSQESEPARAALAEAIVGRLRPGQVIGLDAGSTTVEVAARLPASLAVTIVTNSPAVAVALADHPGSEVILLGGMVDLTWMASTGPSVVDAWRGFHLDVGIVGACGFDPSEGTTTRSAAEVATKQALAAAAAEVIVPVEAEKLGTLAPFHVLDAERVDTLLVESSATGESAAIEACRSAGIDVVTVASAITD